ncbi:MAG: hypothetical protein QXR38_00790 [Nitrososphaerales archaeon]
MTIVLTIQVPISGAQIQPSIDLQGLTWNHTTITVLIVPQSQQSGGTHLILTLPFVP